MNENIYNHLSDIIQKAFSPIINSQPEFDTLKDSIEKLTHTLASCYTKPLANSLSQLSDLCNTRLLKIELPRIPPNALSFIDEINFREECIDLTESECDSINTLFELADIESPLKVESHSKISTIQFVISILIPIIIGFLQLWQNEQHSNSDSIEAQKEQIKEQEYYNGIIQDLSAIINSLNELQESQVSCPCNHSDVPVLQDERSTEMSCDQFQDDSAE